MTRYPEDNHTSPAEAHSRNSMRAKAQPNLVERLSPSLFWDTDREKEDPGRQGLGASVANGVLVVAPEARSPTIGGFVALDDPDGGFSGLTRGRADGTMAAPLLQLVSRDGLGPCVHETPGSRQWNVSVSPGSWSEWSPRAEIEGFETSGTIATLAVEDEPRSITNGTIRVASTEPGFPPAEVSRSIHRCEYDPATGACPLCGETHATTGVSISVTQDYRYALFGTTNMSRFAATVRGGDMDDIVWTVSPALADGVWLHSSDDPDDTGDFEIPGVAEVWADSGLSTNQFTATDETRIRAMVDQANYLFRQVCISCYVHQINYTNHTAWLDLGTWGTPEFSANLQQMTAVSNPVSGIEVHFVDRMEDAVGVNSPHGMALSDQADFHTFAHEAGHARGNIHGIRRTWVTTTSFEMSDDVAVGVFPETNHPYPNHD